MSAEVVNVLLYAGDRILMQLRDEKEGIVFPGCWGFFGGSVDEGERPEATARRELREELSYEPQEIYFLDVGPVLDLGNIVSHAYYCQLAIPLEKIELKEGLDFGLFTLEEVESRFLYSHRLKRRMSVIETQYIPQTIEKLFKRLNGLETVS